MFGSIYLIMTPNRNDAVQNLRDETEGFSLDFLTDLYAIRFVTVL